MDSFSLDILPQYVRQTDEKERINGQEHRLHEVQKRIKKDFEQLPEFTIITAPTGTGKSYAFPFPVLNAKKKAGSGMDSSRAIRGMIVLPTNALIAELSASFQKTYPQLVINELTGPALNRWELKGHARWKKAIDIVEESDLIITNPDIVNYAMHGGYHQWTRSKKTGGTRFSRFLSAFGYVIFDEYHLYDEAQIANILTLVKLRYLFLQHYGVRPGSSEGIRFLFVSATPEVGLRTLLKNEGYAHEEIIEHIVDSPASARAIHGRLTVEFVDHPQNVAHLVHGKLSEILEVLRQGKRALLILDKLRDVQELAAELRTILPQYTVYESTGYVAKGEDHGALVKAAQLIIATNKAEVGVNYDVEYCLMEPGKHYQNFVQRFGRVSRGDLSGKVVVSVPNRYAKFRRRFKKKEELSYYDFIDAMRELLQGRRFYIDRVPMYWGEYLWSIENYIRRHQEYSVGKYLRRRLEETGMLEGKVRQRYYLLDRIHRKICAMMEAVQGHKASQRHWDEQVEALQQRGGRVAQWALWWKNYLETYLTFRDGSKVVLIEDRQKGQTLEYSLDWILQHKVIKEVVPIQKEPYEIVKYIVGPLKEQDKDLQYTVSTLPNVGVQGNNYLSYQEVFDLDKVFRRAVERIDDKLRKGVGSLEEAQRDLLEDVVQLSHTFDRKRLKIEEIENNDNIL